MSAIEKFSEVAEAYNAHLANINEARSIFQKETSSLNARVLEHLSETQSKSINCRWQNAENCSSIKEGNWTSFKAGCRIALDIKYKKNFVKTEAYLYFEIRFVEEEGRFRFICRFENKSEFRKNMDEHIIELIEMETEKFSNFKWVKSDTAILFSRDLTNDLFSDFGKYVNDAIKICERSVDDLSKASPDPVGQVETLESVNG